MPSILISVLVLILAGCASTTPAPVSDGKPAVRVETPLKAGTSKPPPPVKASPAAPPSADGAEVRPIAIGGQVVARPLDSSPPVAASATTSQTVPPAPTLLPSPNANTDKLKHAPKGGKLPYSEENLARLKAQEGRGAAMPAAAAPAPADKPAVTAAPPIAAGELDLAWPATGKVIANFTEGGSGAESYKGIAIAGKIGDAVLAAGPGKVIHVGSMPKYGNLVIVLHANSYSSVYAHNSRILAKEGQQVARGQKIAELGSSDADSPKLHFELRQQGKPVDPLLFLPKR